MSRNTVSIGVAYQDQYLSGGEMAGYTITGSTFDNVSAAELAVLDGASSANTTTGKVAILGTSGAITFGGAVTAVGSFIIGAADLSEADMEQLDGITAGQSAPSKALVVDSAESLLWATTDATASETVTLSVADTRTGAGATGWAIKGDLISNVALGSYANGVYGILSLGAAGKVTGLGAGVVAEIVMGAGCTDGTYAGLEVEIGMGTNALTGTATSFMYLSLYGTAAATFDTSGYLFQLAGYTKAGGKFLQDTTSGSTIRPVQVIKVKTLDGDRYLPLYSTAAIAA